MPLATTLAEYIRAAFSGLYLETQEPAEALRELAELCRQEHWTLATWDIDQGLQLLSSVNPVSVAATDPLAALRSLPALATPDRTTLFVLSNFHRFLNSAEIVQALQHQLLAGKATRTFVVILAPTVQLPLELERQFVVLTHELPHREQLAQIARDLAPDESSSGAAWESLLDAAAGLTRYEAEGAFALSLARHDALRPEAVWELKAQTLRKQNLLTLCRGGETFGSLGGLAALKEFCRRALQPSRSVKARGTLLLSPPGCGKSAFCRA
ncbi:MAG: AAA family ATPase, partial [Planctomycetaceae bacterium]|nr:AAA family ATPase [Planctomycetaceae bacterium]